MGLTFYYCRECRELQDEFRLLITLQALGDKAEYLFVSIIPIFNFWTRQASFRNRTFLPLIILWPQRKWPLDDSKLRLKLHNCISRSHVTSVIITFCPTLNGNYPFLSEIPFSRKIKFTVHGIQNFRYRENQSLMIDHSITEHWIC